MRPRDLFKGHWGLMGGGPWGQGGYPIGIPLGHQVGLMSLQIIHEAYMPVYIHIYVRSKFFLRMDGRTNRRTEVFHEALADLKRVKQVVCV